MTQHRTCDEFEEAQKVDSQKGQYIFYHREWADKFESDNMILMHFFIFIISNRTGNGITKIVHAI